MKSDSLRPRSVTEAILWRIIIASVVFFFSLSFTGIDPQIDAQIIYFAIVSAYLIIGQAFVKEINEKNTFSFVGNCMVILLKINVAILVFLLIGYLLHFFPFFNRLPIKSILGWPSLVTIIIFTIITIVGSHILNDTRKEFYNQLRY